MNYLRHLTDTDLLAVLHIEAGLLSYYHAGWDYARSIDEREAELRCESRFYRLVDEADRRGLDWRADFISKNYLIALRPALVCHTATASGLVNNDAPILIVPASAVVPDDSHWGVDDDQQ